MRYQIREKEVKAVTSNMVSKGKKIREKEYELDADDEKPYHFTQLKSGVVAPRNYKKLLKEFCDDDSDNSVITSPTILYIFLTTKINVICSGQV